MNKKSSSRFFSFLFLIIILDFASILPQTNDDCFMCHEDQTLTKKRKGKTVSLFVDAKKISKSIHAELDCISCHEDLDGAEIPHDENLKPAQCATCHSDVEELYNECMHGKAANKGDALAPRCATCHGSHEILPVKNPKSKVYASKIPFVCGSCHKEGSPVSRQRNIPQDSILENYSESIHGEGLLKKGLIVSANCASCHTPHRILPHTDSRSTINRKNIASTCIQCHVEIENVHQKVIKGTLWEKEAHVLPACVDCHQPHKARKVFYAMGMANADCMNCHANSGLKAADGRSMFVNESEVSASMHQKIACSQCHAEVSPSKGRACATIKNKVDCASCHASQGEEFRISAHGTLHAEGNADAPYCSDCHNTHNILGAKNPKSKTFSTNVPDLCADCHREGAKAAKRYKGKEHNIAAKYSLSIHGKGLIESGLTVTATCTDCHTAHRELPHTNPASSVHHDNVASTCGTCHHGIEEKYSKSIHSKFVNKTDKKLPSCNDCHSSHTIRRSDEEGFKLQIMDQCGKCHEEIAATYFETYHGKVSQLGYTKTAKCYDCHGAHDILPPTDPASHLSRANVVETCKKCHEGANKQFAGYFSHATHHDPDKYPILYWTFRAMTTLLIVTFILAGLHTLLWLPRSLKYRRELKNILEGKDKVE